MQKNNIDENGGREKIMSNMRTVNATKSYASADDVIKENIEGPTRRQYENLNKQYVRYLIENDLTEGSFVRPDESDTEGDVPFSMDVDTLKLPVNTTHYLNFIHSVSKLSDNEDPFASAPVTTPYNTMAKYRSALRKLYTENNKKFQPALETKLGLYLAVVEKIIAKEKKAGVRAFHDGKNKLSFHLYSRLCVELLTCDTLDADELHCFFTICWNMMARSDTVSSIMLSHLEWDNDHLTIVVPQHKGDQKGTSGEVAMTKHIFANPHNPPICPLLWLSVYVVTHDIGFSCSGDKKNAPFISR